jgi:hypothetical protein
MDTHNTDVNPHELARAQAGWSSFTKTTKYATLGVIAILVLMAIFLL